MAELRARVASVEARPQQDVGSRRRFDKLFKRVDELEDEIREMDTRLAGCEEATGTFLGAAGDLSFLKDEKSDDELVDNAGWYEGEYVTVHDVLGRPELTGMIGMLVLKCDVGWEVRLRTEE